MVGRKSSPRNVELKPTVLRGMATIESLVNIGPSSTTKVASVADVREWVRQEAPSGIAPLIAPSAGLIQSRQVPDVLSRLLSAKEAAQDLARSGLG